MPGIDNASLSLPRFDVFHYGIEDTSIPTRAYTLSPPELADVKAQFSAVFSDGRTLEFGPISARQSSRSGELIVCGLVNVRRSDSRDSGMQLFDGIANSQIAGQRVSFTPRHIAGANARTIDVYSVCRDAGLFGGANDTVATRTPDNDTMRGAASAAAAVSNPTNLPSAPAPQQPAGPSAAAPVTTPAIVAPAELPLRQALSTQATSTQAISPRSIADHVERAPKR